MAAAARAGAIITDKKILRANRMRLAQARMAFTQWSEEVGGPVEKWQRCSDEDSLLLELGKLSKVTTMKLPRGADVDAFTVNYSTMMKVGRPAAARLRPQWAVLKCGVRLLQSGLSRVHSQWALPQHDKGRRLLEPPAMLTVAGC